jgi:hypothetical protein
LIIGSTFPLSPGLFPLTIWFYPDKSENRSVIYLIIGILLGLIIDYKFLNGWINRRFDLSILAAKTDLKLQMGKIIKIIRGVLL